MIRPFYFSPTGTVKKITTLLAESFSQLQETPLAPALDFTLPQARKNPAVFSSADFVIAGIPVYAGRVPNILLSYLKTLEGNGALTAAVAVYGNRHYDDALLEWVEILKHRGFQIAAAGAFIGEHSFSTTLAGGRPDAEDALKIKEFVRQIHEKLQGANPLAPFEVPGHFPPRPYYVPKNLQGQTVDIRKVTPKTHEHCIQCGLCASICPMGSIDFQDFSKLNGICIKCCACIKGCPEKARYFDDAGYLWHKEELEKGFSARREPEWFL